MTLQLFKKQLNNLELLLIFYFRSSRSEEDIYILLADNIYNMCKI